MNKKNLKNLLVVLNKKGNVDTELGVLCNFALSGTATFDLDVYLSEAYGKSIRDIEPKAYVRALAKFTCYPLSSLGENGERPKNYQLSDDDLEKLSDLSLENIALLQLKGTNTSSSPDDELDQDRCIFSDIHSQHIKVKNKMSKHQLEMADHIKNLQTSVFSDELQAQLKNTSLLGDSLHQQINQMRSLNVAGTTSALDAYNKTINPHQIDLKLAIGPELAHMKDLVSHSLTTSDALSASVKAADFLSSHTIPEPKLAPTIDWGKSFRDKEEARRIPFRELGTKLDKLVNITAQSVQYMNQMNENMRLAAEETKRSSDAASRNVKWTLFLTIVSILISVVALKPSWVGISNSSPEQLLDIGDLKHPTEVKSAREKGTSSIDENSLLEIQIAPHNSETSNPQLE